MKLATTHGTLTILHRMFNTVNERGESSRVVEVHVKLPHDGCEYVGFARCKPRKFQRRKGRHLALASALDLTGISRSYRADIWFAYLGTEGEQGQRDAVTSRRKFMARREQQRLAWEEQERSRGTEARVLH